MRRSAADAVAVSAIMVASAVKVFFMLIVLPDLGWSLWGSKGKADVPAILFVEEMDRAFIGNERDAVAAFACRVIFVRRQHKDEPVLVDIDVEVDFVPH